MAEEIQSTQAQPQAPLRTKDEIALEMMKFIVGTTGIGKPAGAAGFVGGKPSTRTAEENVDTLLQLFERCRSALAK
jgi:hypothetical protein